MKLIRAMLRILRENRYLIAFVIDFVSAKMMATTKIYRIAIHDVSTTSSLDWTRIVAELNNNKTNLWSIRNLPIPWLQSLRPSANGNLLLSILMPRNILLHERVINFLSRVVMCLPGGVLRFLTRRWSRPLLAFYQFVRFIASRFELDFSSDHLIPSSASWFPWLMP